MEVENQSPTSNGKRGKDMPQKEARPNFSSNHQFEMMSWWVFLGEKTFHVSFTMPFLVGNTRLSTKVWDLTTNLRVLCGHMIRG